MPIISCVAETRYLILGEVGFLKSVSPGFKDNELPSRSISIPSKPCGIGKIISRLFTRQFNRTVGPANGNNYFLSLALQIGNICFKLILSSVIRSKPHRWSSWGLGIRRYGRGRSWGRNRCRRSSSLLKLPECRHIRRFPSLQGGMRLNTFIRRTLIGYDISGFISRVRSPVRRPPSAVMGTIANKRTIISNKAKPFLL